MAEIINFPDINTELTSGFWNWVKNFFGNEDQRRRRHGRKAELQVCSILQKNLPDTFLVVNNYRIDTPAGEKDIDHVVAGPTGIFCIDTKGVTGNITVNEDGGFDRKKTGMLRTPKSIISRLRAMSRASGASSIERTSRAIFIRCCVLRQPMSILTRSGAWRSYIQAH